MAMGRGMSNATLVPIRTLLVSANEKPKLDTTSKIIYKKAHTRKRTFRQDQEGPLPLNRLQARADTAVLLHMRLMQVQFLLRL